MHLTGGKYTKLSIKIALVGNPNCGKTTIFNCVTKNHQKTGNWPGVTVEKKISYFKKDNKIKIIDLPGIYSLSHYSPEEQVSSNFILQNKADIIINVISATNLERSLYLTLQLLELEIPMIIAITMTDLLKKRGDFFNIQKFSKIFNCSTITVTKNDLNSNTNLIQKAIEKSKQNKTKEINNLPYLASLNPEIIKILNLMNPTQKNKIKNFKWTALNLIKNDNTLKSNLNLSNEQKHQIQIIKKNIEKQTGENFQKFLINTRYAFINQVLKKFYTVNNTKTITISDKIDYIFLNRWLALPIFIIIISIIYFFSISILGKPISDWLNSYVLKQKIIPTVYNFLNLINIQNWLINLICYGLINGVGSVLIFIPQLFILFTFISFIEECGYMSRIAFITDKLFSNIGLCGQSTISFLMSSNCGVHGVFATKTIKNPLTRFITLTTTTFIPCSAKIPIIAAIGSLFFKNSWIIAPITYCISFIAILLCSIFLKNQSSEKESNQFLMEITPYQLPSLNSIMSETIKNIKAFVIKAGSVISIASLLIWFTSNLNVTSNGLVFVSEDNSILAKIAKTITPIFKPLGFANWQTTTAVITGLIAKENVVNTLEVLSSSITNSNSTQTISLLFKNQAAALSFLIFNVLCIPCCIATYSIYKQTQSLIKTFKITAIQTITAYFFAAITFLITNKIFQ